MHCNHFLLLLFRNYFTSAVFAKLQHGDPYGRISIMALFNYIMRKVWYHQTRIGLSLYDFVGQGYLREVVSHIHCNAFSFSWRKCVYQEVWFCFWCRWQLCNLHQNYKLSVESVWFICFTIFQDLENYILELIPTLPQLDGLEKSFHSFYVCTAVRKFLFFLDPLRTGRVRIQDILACSFLDDLLEVHIIIREKFRHFTVIANGVIKVT